MGVGAAIVGGAVVGGYMTSQATKSAAGTSAAASDRAAQMSYEQYMQSRQDLSPYREVDTGAEILDDKGNIVGYEGGALNTLADYGRSNVRPGDYIPDSNIPAYQGSTIGDMPAIDQRVSDFNYQGDIPKFSVEGDIPEFDSTQFDIYKDPSYEWRKEEMLRGLDRTAGAAGKITSGNRMEDIMERTGEMASQEYGAARDRMVQDYGIRRENEASQYGRDVYGYGEDRNREQDIYGRASSEYGLTRGAEDARYGRGVDEYGRVYGRDVDQYGRDLTGYNAQVAQEASMYGRGVDAYGRAYGQEGDYLNRLASLSQTGQTAVNTGVQAGASAAYTGGQAVQAAGQAQAAGQIGSANAWSNTIGDLSSLYAMNQYQPTNTYNYSGAGGGIPYNSFVNDSNYIPYGG